MGLGWIGCTRSAIESKLVGVDDVRFPREHDVGSIWGRAWDETRQAIARLVNFRPIEI